MSYKSLNLLLLSLFILAACGGGGGGTAASAPANSCSPSTTNLCITVAGGKFVVQNSSSTGVSQKTLTLNAGTYTFDQTNSSNVTPAGAYGTARIHQIAFSTTSDGTHGSGSAYTTGVTTSGSPGSTGKTTIVVNSSTPSTLYYYCQNHSGMGGTINIVIGNQSSQVEFTETN